MIDYKQAKKLPCHTKRMKVLYDADNMKSMFRTSLYDDIFSGLYPIIPAEKTSPLDKDWESTK